MEIRVYGADWCSLTFRVREYLMNARLRYEFLDIDRDAQARAFVRAVGAGRLTIPLILVGDDVLTGPTIPELQIVLRAHAIGSHARRRRSIGATT
jgi:hypothetical protein